MRRIWFAIIAMAPASAIGQTTTCDTFGTTTTCRTPEVAAPPAVGNTYLEMQERQARISAIENAGDSEGRGKAYQQVGELIAKGDCQAANRLADFYGRRDLKKDTARACPGK